MITGFNTDIEFEGVTYHVQTEDKGLDSPLILSLVYVGGAIIASKRTPYDDLVSAGYPAAFAFHGAARGINPVLNFALEEAQLRKAVLCVVYVKEVVVYFSAAPTASGRSRWQEDPEANAIMSLMLKEGHQRGVCVLPVYAVSEDAAATIVDLSATMGVDCLVLGTTQRGALTNLLRGSVATHIAENLPDSIRLVIFG